MRDKILATYVVMDILFIITGGLLILFALTTKAEIAETLTLDNVARDLILTACPLNGMYFKTSNVRKKVLTSASNNCKLGFRFLHLPHVGARDRYANDPRLAQIQWIHDRLLCAFHDDHRSYDLVRDVKDTKESLRYLGLATSIYPIAPSTTCKS